MDRTLTLTQLPHQQKLKHHPNMRRYSFSTSTHKTSSHFSPSLISPPMAPPIRLSSLILFIHLLFSSSSSFVAAEDVVDGFVLRYYTPDFTSHRSLYPLLWTVVSTPVYLVYGWILYRRRRLFPLAQRGASMLMLTTAILIASTWGWMIPTIWFPDAMPCGLQILILYLSLTAALLVYAIRGWILVFKWEITQQLNLFRHKNQTIHRCATTGQTPVATATAVGAGVQQRPQLKQMNGDKDTATATAKVAPMPTQAALPSTAAAAVATGRSEMATNGEPKLTDGGDIEAQLAASKPNTTMATPNATTTTTASRTPASTKSNQLELLYEGPGGWYVKNRHLSEKRFLTKVVLILYGVIVVTLVVLLFWDPDVAVVGGDMQKDGTDLYNAFCYGMYGQQPLPSDPNIPRFTKLDGCPDWSIKIMCTRLYMGAIIPVYIFVWWKLRKKEKDGAGVQIELVLVAIIASLGLVGYPTIDVLGVDGYLNWEVTFCYFLGFAVSVIWPVYVSFKVEKQKKYTATKQRALKRKGGGGGVGGGGGHHHQHYRKSQKQNKLLTKKGGGGGRESMYIDWMESAFTNASQIGSSVESSTTTTAGAGDGDATITAPFFDLFFVLNHPDASEAFLKFLTKEFSSENAYFWYEVREFALYALELERQLSHWPQRPGSKPTTGAGNDAQTRSQKTDDHPTTNHTTVKTYESSKLGPQLQQPRTFSTDLDADYVSKWACAASTISYFTNHPSSAVAASACAASASSSTPAVSAARQQFIRSVKRRTVTSSTASIDGASAVGDIGAATGATTGAAAAGGVGVGFGVGAASTFSLPNSTICHSPRSLRRLNRRTTTSMMMMMADETIPENEMMDVHGVHGEEEEEEDNHINDEKLLFATTSTTSPRALHAASTSLLPAPPPLPPSAMTGSSPVSPMSSQPQSQFQTQSQPQPQSPSPPQASRQTSRRSAIMLQSNEAERTRQATMQATQNRMLQEQAMDLQQQALTIYDQYLSRNAPYEVNLPNAISHVLHEKIRKIREWKVVKEEKIVWKPTTIPTTTTATATHHVAISSASKRKQSAATTATTTTNAQFSVQQVINEDGAAASSTEQDEVCCSTTQSQTADGTPISQACGPSCPPSAASANTSTSSAASSTSLPWTTTSSSSSSPIPSASASAPTPILIDGPPSAPPFILSSFFHPSEHAIFELMQRDSFRRFIATKEFKHLLEEEVRHQYLLQHQQDDDDAEDEDDGVVSVGALGEEHHDGQYDIHEADPGQLPDGTGGDHHHRGSNPHHVMDSQTAIEMVDALEREEVEAFNQHH